MFFLRRPSTDAVERVLNDGRAAAPTFPHVGATRSSTAVAGFRSDGYAGVIGHGTADFDAARDGLRAWAAHAGAGVAITPVAAPLEDGATVVGASRTGPMHVLFPCRVVYVVDEPERFGFAYATLPGHPVCGEEAFIASLGADDAVSFAVSSISRPAELLAKLGAPVSRFVQRRTNHAYVGGLAAFVERQRRS